MRLGSVRTVGPDCHLRSTVHAHARGPHVCPTCSTRLCGCPSLHPHSRPVSTPTHSMFPHVSVSRLQHAHRRPACPGGHAGAHCPGPSAGPPSAANCPHLHSHPLAPSLALALARASAFAPPHPLEPAAARRPPPCPPTCPLAASGHSPPPRICGAGQTGLNGKGRFLAALAAAGLPCTRSTQTLQYWAGPGCPTPYCAEHRSESSSSELSSSRLAPRPSNPGRTQALSGLYDTRHSALHIISRRTLATWGCMLLGRRPFTVGWDSAGNSPSHDVAAGGCWRGSPTLGGAAAVPGVA